MILPHKYHYLDLLFLFGIHSNFFNCTKLNLGLFTTFEYLAVVIRSHQQRPTLILSVYRPPKHNNEFLSEFAGLLSIAVTKYDSILLVGDFNFKNCNLFCRKNYQYLLLIHLTENPYRSSVLFDSTFP